MMGGMSTPPAAPDTTSFDDPRITAMGLLVEVYTGLMDRLSPQIGEHGLSTVDFTVLVRLSRSQGQRLRMSDLAAQTSLSTSGVTRVADRLEKEGLVVRENCPTDRRALYAVLTRDGADRIGGVLPGHLDLLQRWLIDPLSERQLAGLLDGLRTVRDTANPGASAGAA